ncbi:MAG TPA: hypothetical protein VIO62_02140 [Candidatus Dormibacteraeota bacterium]
MTVSGRERVRAALALDVADRPPVSAWADWPVMPVVRIGFAMRPVGFFDFNPALDVAPPEACHHNGG